MMWHSLESSSDKETFFLKNYYYYYGPLVVDNPLFCFSAPTVNQKVKEKELSILPFGSIIFVFVG